MDRIQIALEMAKEEQEKGKSTIITAASSSRQGLAERIIYTQTRSVKALLSHLREHRIIAAFEESAFTHAYKILRTQVMHRMRENGWNVLGVTSPGEKEGKTVTAANLAINLAMEVGQSVLLVDANLRNPCVHRIFGAEEGKGLVEYLMDDLPLEALLIHPDIGRLVLLPGGRRICNSAEWLSSPKMIALVQELKHRYPARMILFDLPPLFNSADVLAFSPHLDALLLVVEAGRTHREDIEKALHLIQATPVVGVVLNKKEKRFGSLKR